MPWKPDAFEIAMPYGPAPRAGYTYRGLGLHLARIPRKGKWPAEWTLTHLGSGHSLCNIKGSVSEAFPIATEIAEAGDWDFLSMEGYKDRFPDAPKVLAEILDRHSKATKRYGNGPGDREIASQIAANRP